MKLELNTLASGLNITAYSDASVSVADRVYTRSIIIGDERIIEDLLPAHIAKLQQHQLDTVISMQPEIVLFGSGATLHYPADGICQTLFEHNIGMEIMDTGAACRSFNFLSGEARRVVALLFIAAN